jgi:hypothetical protein
MSHPYAIPQRKRLKAASLLRDGVTVSAVAQQLGLTYQGVVGIAASFKINARRTKKRAQITGDRGVGEYAIAATHVVQRAVMALGRTSCRTNP